ncbi:CopD family protein [Gulosibacter sp. 10]|uniref:copper resistance CopC/CopD family protein n=1 Tax=Gulosibacter sp. 10 TaxID=1255570 RepID=UPI001595E3EC|nr:CopD family protein [Gulosibacter sp. 10]
MAAVLGVLVALQLLPGQRPAPVSAHANIVSTSPEHGAELDEPPAEVVVVYDEPVTFGPYADAATVVNLEGERFDAGPARLDESRTRLTIPIQADLPEDAYIASWRVVSADTHPVGGSLQFGYGVPASVLAPSEPEEPSSALTLAVGLVKGVLYLGLVIAFGVPAAAAVLGVSEAGRKRIRTGTVLGFAVIALASLLQLVTQFLWLRSSGGMQGEAALADVLEFARSEYAMPVWVRMALLGATLLASKGGSERRRLIVLLSGGAAALVTVVLNGHGGGSPVALISTVLHAAAATAWLGGLVSLAVLMLRRRLSEDGFRRMGRWSLYATICVAVLLASGMLQSVDAVRYPQALFETTYGWILLAKLGLVAFALLLGGLGWRWVRRVSRDNPDGRPAPGQTARLRRRVRWEAGAAAAAIVVSGLLSSLEPAGDEWAPLALQEAEIGPYHVTVQIAPARLGPQTFKVTVLPLDPAQPNPPELGVTLQQVDGVLGDLPVEFPYRLPAPLSPGEAVPVTFTSAAVNVPETGEWEGTITLVVDRLEQYSGTVRYEVR